MTSVEDIPHAHNDLHWVTLRMVHGRAQVPVMSPRVRRPPGASTRAPLRVRARVVAPIFGALFAVTSCQGIGDDATARAASARPHGGAWTTVLETDAVTVAIDTASAVRWWNDTYAVLVRSDHVKPRARDGRAWDREVASVQLRCDYFATRTRAVRLSLGDGAPILDQRETESDVWDQPWAEAGRGTDEERAARAACALLQVKPRPPESRRGQRAVPSL